MLTEYYFVNIILQLKYKRDTVDSRFSLCLEA